MKVLERLGLVDRIGRELQSRMSYAEIAAYLKAYGIDTKKPTSGINSKWVYSKELLGDEKDEVILKIADELQLPHNHVVSNNSKTHEASFWEPSHFRLFLSHLSSFKQNTAKLQAALRKFGVSAFVAHVDIEPTREWLDEIEAGLFSMDALAAIIMPGFKESNWTDQEVGVAIGRGVLIIPILRGLNPYGFISKYQGLNANGKTVSTVAEEIFKILTTSSKTRSRMLSCLTETTLQSKSEDEAMEKLRHIASVKDFPVAHLQRLQETALSSTVLSSPKPLEKLNQLLAKNNLKAVAPKQSFEPVHDDVPF